ncbi:MAG: phosphoadenylyl-sulfate reductase [Acidimicrobiia bacterium]
MRTDSPLETLENTPEIAPGDAAAVLAWAELQFGNALVFTSSFEEPVLLHLVATHAPSARIVFLDTQYHFPETLEYRDELAQQLGISVEVIHPLPEIQPDERYRNDAEGCCFVRKVEPLRRCLQGADAWITGIRRIDGPTRAGAPRVSRDATRDLVKLNPIVDWDDEQMEAYVLANDLPEHPLKSQGYLSIGCAPCTQPVAEGQDRRAGRWAGLDKTECGLHL